MKKTTSIIILLALMGVMAGFWFFYEKSTNAPLRESVNEKTFPERLRIMAESEKSIAHSLRANMSMLAGLPVESLAPVQQDLLASLASRQNDIRKEFSKWDEDMKDYLSANTNETYAEVLLAIEKSNIEEGLQETQDHIAKNFTFRAVNNAQYWSEQMREWAEQMETGKSGNTGSASE